MELQFRIEELFDNPKKEYNAADERLFTQFKQALNRGEIRAAEKIRGNWAVHTWIKKGILLGFRIGKIIEMPGTPATNFYDKSTYPEKRFSADDQVRLVPGGSSVRDGSFIASSVTMMPPMFVNVGAYVDEGTMIDSHALVGSCAQVGRNVHISAAAILGGVLEPIGNNPVIIEDNVFVGGNSGLYEGVLVQEWAIIAPGTIITAGTPVYDSVHQIFLPKEPGKAVTIPAGAVVVPGSRALKNNPDFQVYCPIIIKYRDSKSEVSVALEMELR